MSHASSSLARVGRAIYWARGSFAVPLFAAVLLVGHPAPYGWPGLEGVRSLAGWSLLVSGLLLRVWGVACWFTRDADGVLGGRRLMMADGPYAYVRNPRYLGNLLMGMGLGVLIGIRFVLPLYGLLWAVVHVPIMAAERETLEGRHGEVYAAYCDRVPAFWPRCEDGPPLAGQLLGLNWPAACAEEMGTLSGWLALGSFVEWWRAAHLEGSWLANTHFLVMIPLLLIGGEALRRRLQARQFSNEDRPLRP